MNRFGCSFVVEKLALTTVLIVLCGVSHAQQQGARTWAADGCVYQFHGRQWMKTSQCQTPAQRRVLAQTVQQIAIIKAQLAATQAAEAAQARARQTTPAWTPGSEYFVLGGGANSSTSATGGLGVSGNHSFTIGGGSSGTSSIGRLQEAATNQMGLATQQQEQFARSIQNPRTKADAIVVQQFTNGLVQQGAINSGRAQCSNTSRMTGNGGEYYRDAATGQIRPYCY